MSGTSAIAFTVLVFIAGWLCGWVAAREVNRS